MSRQPNSLFRHYGAVPAKSCPGPKETTPASKIITPRELLKAMRRGSRRPKR